MDCVRCGNPTPEKAAFCPACGARVPGGPPPAPPTIRLDRPLVRDEGTVLAGAALAPEVPAEAPISSDATHADATVVSPGPIGSQAWPDATVLAVPADPDATVIGRPLVGRAVDRDATILATPADPDATMMGRPPLGSESDPDATMLGAPLDPDATFLGGRPIGGTSAGDVTVIGPPPRKRTGTMVRTPARVSAARAARTMGGHEVQPEEGGGPLAVGEQFGRYTIIRLLGIGGMGAVYQAWDEELEVVVAVKVIQTDGSIDAATVAEVERRFKRELLLARRVTHKNVVRIFDLGEIDGIKYITMSYVNGVDLTHLLEADGKLPLPKALQVIRGVVDGLVAAHDADVVHRDLKPANIMLAAGSDEPLIMDFGIARTTSAPQEKSKGLSEDDAGFKESSALANATMAGAVVGTLGYMAPEQAKGKDVDQRADVYALGLIFYDLLLGMRRQEATPKPFEELMLRMKEPPPSPRSVNEEIPEEIDRIIMRCIDPDPAARYPTSKALKDDLDGLDAEGKPLPRFRRLTPRMVAAVSVVGIGLLSLLGWSGWTMYQERQAAAERNREPVSVLIADFQNRTSDPVFDGTLEPMVKMALEGAGFISAYDRLGIRRSLGVRPPEKLDEAAAQEIALKQGVGIVLAGSLDRDGDGYVVSVKAVQTVSGTEIASATESASGKDDVVQAATNVAGSVRKALGDRTSSDSAQRFAMDALSAASLPAIREYARAMEALADSKFENARDSFSKAVGLDPNFGLAYAGMAIASRNLDKHQEAEEHVKEAIRHLDGMTERERYRTRGLYYYLTGDYQACVKEYSDLIARYAADAAARNNLALCMTYQRDVSGAVEQMQSVVKILPNRALYRENLATYATYASNFEMGEKVARALQEPSVFGLLPLAFAQMGQEQIPQATETYRVLGRIDEQGASYMASGLADIAIYEGRFSDAIKILTTAAATDVNAKDADRAAAKLVAIAYARLLQGQKALATAAAEEALTHSRSVRTRFLAARIFAEAGATKEAQTVAAELGSEFQAHPRAYAKIVEGLIALANKQPREAVKALMESTTLLDTWIGRFDLGRAYFEAGAFTQADSEFDRCLKRRGEALSLFVDEEPTYAYFPPVYYYQGRVREELGTAAFADSYRAYLKVRGTSTEDRLVPDVRSRVAR